MMVSGTRATCDQQAVVGLAALATGPEHLHVLHHTGCLCVSVKRHVEQEADGIGASPQTCQSNRSRSLIEIIANAAAKAQQR